MREKLKKLTALLLSISMVLSLFTSVLPAAYAEGGGDSTPVSGNANYDDIVGTGQPGLYVDFLGDNRIYKPADGETATVLTSGVSGLPAPGLVDQSAETNPGGSRTWTGYKNPRNESEKETDEFGGLYEDNKSKETIFWVGVGINNMDKFDLFQQEDRGAPDGVYSLELGFYYDNRYIEPYIGPGKSYTANTDAEIQQAYQSIITEANLSNYQQYKWTNYSVVSAETGLMPQTDWVTQETLAYSTSNGYWPNMDQIMQGEPGVDPHPWRMTYVAIERDGEQPNRGFTGKGEGTQYLLIIPFRLKNYDDNHSNNHLCLRLARNAGMFSIGGGEDGSIPYAAWERTTIRNPGRELKLMANFRGDLDIFGGGRVRDELYSANLYLDNGGGTGNTAKMSVDGDPSTNPAMVIGQSQSDRTITGLPAGTGMQVDITVQTGYEAKVSVYPAKDRYQPSISYYLGPNSTKDASKTYSFVMPAENMQVDVIFAITGNTTFYLYLDEDRDGDTDVDPDRIGETPVKPGNTVQGNETVLTARYPGNETVDPATAAEVVTVDKDSPDDPTLTLPKNLPGEKVTIEATDTGIYTSLEVEVSLHADYYAEVEIVQVSTGSNYPISNDTAPWFSIGANNVVTVTSSGTLKVSGLPQSDIIVQVKYLLAKRVTGILEVWHQNPPPVPGNVAQLRTLGYDDNNKGMPAYSGVVYDNDKVTPENHREVETNPSFRVLERIETQAAALSGSLGGDGNIPVSWLEMEEELSGGGTRTVPNPNSMMAVLYSATSASGFAGKINAYDLRKLTGLTMEDGLRKNSEGDYYADSEMSDFFARLWEIRTLAADAAADPTAPVTVDVKPALDPDDPTKTLFSYYDLTPDQIQVYLLDYENYQADTTGTVSAPELRSDADAKAELAKYSWYDPTADNGTRPPSMPETLSDGYMLVTRAGRRMEVVLEASSVYTMLDRIKILDKEDYDSGVETEIPSVTVTQDPDYKNVFRFNVPDKDYIVKVVYKKRETRKLELTLKTSIGAVDPGNEATVTAFTPDPNSPAAKSVVKTKNTSGTEIVAEDVLVDSTVTVLVKKMPGYTASATVTAEGNDIIITSPPDISDLGEAKDLTLTSITFKMPSKAVEIQITYKLDVDIHNANIIVAGDRGTSSAVWSDVKTWRRPSYKGEPLHGSIQVDAGYYIAAVEAYTGANAYPFSLSGNGWNNGAGGHVTLDTFMPDEEYYVRITFAKGPPPEEERMALALQVMDPDNVVPYVDNYATAQAGTVTLGPVGLIKTGPFNTNNASIAPIPGSAEPITELVKAGELVTVEYVVQDGFALDSIVVEPAALGVTPVYVTGADSKVRAQFTMPSASARVVVTFRKTENITKELFLSLNKTENGVLATGTNHGVSGNKVTWVKSDTFDKNPALGSAGNRQYNIPSGIPATVPQMGATGTGVANPGEKVSFDVQVASGWYVHSMTLTDEFGNRLSYSLDTVGGELVASFTMPASDVTAIVNYRQGTPPDPEDPKDTDSDRLLELVVLDPDNKGSGDPLVYVDNWAKAEVTGATTATLGELGLDRSATRDGDYVKAGDRVELQYQARPGYTLEVITVTSDGIPRTIAPIYTDPMDPDSATPGKAVFTMPDANVTAVVRFQAVTDTKPVHEYTANLVLHMPAGVDIEDYDIVGEGTFGHDLSNKYYSLTALPGETIDFTAWAKDGYYIQRVSVTPAALGVSATISGAFGLQDGSFVMPAADVQVNVFFVELDKEKEWPKEVPYSLTLEVYDATGKGGTANFENIAGTALTAPDSDLVGSGETKTLTDYNGGKLIHELDRVTVALDPADGTYVRSITVTDSRGSSSTVPWSYVPGGIAFDMPPAHVKVTIHYAKRDDDIDKDRKHNVTLYIRNNKDGDYASLDTDTQHTQINEGSLSALFAGDVVTLTATPDRTVTPYHSVASAYVVMVDSSGGAPVVIPTTGLLPSTTTTQTGMPLVAAGGQVQFAMPDADAEVYVTFIDGGVPEPGELTGSLMVVGPTGSGSAVMTAAEGSKQTTGDVAASGGGALFAPEGTELTVDLTVNSGYAISSIRVVDGAGKNVPYTWTDGTQKHFKLEMPPTGVQVYVELEQVDVTKELTVQVVVNNGGGAGNTAKLRLGSTAVGGGQAILSPVYAGNEIYLDMTVQVGYRIDSIQVVPAKFGIAPSLTKRNTVDQTTSFTMPGEDLVVYVHFKSDGRTRLTANLVTEGHYNDENRAMIHSDYSGDSRWVSPTPSTATTGLDRDSVQAAPATATDPAEWVTVDYTWAANNSVESITVELLDGTAVPFTQNEDLEARKGEITFPMADGDVTVKVKYRENSDPVYYRAVLHVIDRDNDTEKITDISWAELTWTAGDRRTGQITAKAPFPGNIAEITVPAGQKVRVDANTVSDGVYLWSGYVLYRQGGQMIKFNFKTDASGKGFSGDNWAEFVMHPGVNDVYVYYTKTEPNDKDFSAVLMIDSPEGDTVSTATMVTADVDSPGPTSTGVVANRGPSKTEPDHGYIISSKGETITVTVNPAAGYTIDSVLMTPLGVSDDNGDPIVPVRSGGSRYTFKMPGQNVAILVKLKTSSAGEYTATLHYASADPGDTTFTKDIARAILYYDDGRTDIDGDWLKVSEGTSMGLDVCINNDVDTDYLVLAAYVLQPDGKIVLLDPALEGTTDVVAGKDAADGTADFSMPASDVDVYVWFTQEKPPTEEWHTAVLTVTDTNSTTVNSGKNSARFWSSVNNEDKNSNDSDYEELPHFVQSYGVKKVDGTNAHGFFWVEEGETVTVRTNPPANGYIFAPKATITHSASGVVNDLTEGTGEASSGIYTYTYTVGKYNSAVHAHFVASDIVQNMLNVRIIDTDNPGNGSVTNVVNVVPKDMTALKVESTTSAGARQRIPNVREGIDISFTVTPDKIPGSTPEERYMAVARWINDNTGNSTILLLTPQSDGSYVGESFNMPNAPATLEVTFFKAWNVTLSVTHTAAVPAADRDSVAQLTENAFNTTITAVEGTPGTVTVPNATDLAASMQTLNSNVRVAGVLLKRSGRPDLQLYPGTDDIYRHTLSRSDVEIQFILAPETEDDPTYIASVSAENKPAAVDDPEIHVMPPLGPRGEADGWTEAKANDTVEVTLDVPYGYKAVLTATNDAILSETTVDATDVAAGITDKTVTFDMPAKNVHVTVKYVKTRFTATIVVTGNGNGTAVWDNYPTTAVVTDLLGGESLPFTATPNADSRISSIIGSGSIGYISGSTNSTVNRTVTMPPEDIVVTVVFTKEKTHGYHLDLHVSGTAGGSATLTATPGTLQSTPGTPNGFSRLEGVESGDGVTLTATPEPGYSVTVSYYLYSGGALTYVTDTITPNPDNGGVITFDMPATNTCVYVNFRKGENPPKTDPDDPKDPERYLELHVSGTGGGTATLVAEDGTLQSTPTNPRSVSKLQPVTAGKNVTLTVTPEDGYTATVTYYVYHSGVPVPTTLTAIPSTGGAATFVMPNQSTCVYVTFRAEKDSMHYLDLHVTNPQGGDATLSTDGFGALTSTPAAPQTYGQLKPVEDGTPVTLTVAPGPNYTVTVSYYRHDNGNLYYTSYLIDTGNGGVATFDMPNVNTCIYVKFNGPGDEPTPDPDDNEKYLDLHVNGTQGGTATLTTTGFGSLTSTPTVPQSYGQLKPVDPGTSVTLDVTLEDGYTASVGYTVYNGGTPVPIVLATIPATGGTATFEMPDQSTCVYVTFKRDDNPSPTDPDKYLDLHVSGLANGSASLTTTEDTSRTISSTPTNPKSVSTLKPVAAGTPVTLEVTPEPGYVVTVSYYVHNGGTPVPTILATIPSTGTGSGPVTFEMPDQSTCVYVHFHQPTDPPDPEPEPDPPPPDPNEYIAFVVTTGTDGLPDNAAQDIVNRTDPTKTGGAIWRYGETGDNMFVTFTTEPGYTAIVTAWRVDSPTVQVPVVQLGTTLVGTASLNMPGGTDVKVLITYSKVEPPKSHNLSLRLIGHDYVTGNMGELSDRITTIARNGQDGTVSTTASAGTRLYLDAGWAEKYRIRRITVESGGVTTDLNWNEYLQTATSDFFMPDGDTLVTVYFNPFYKATLFVIDADGNDFLSDSAADTYDPSAAGIVPQTRLEVTRLSDPVGDTTKTHTPIGDLYGDERVTTTIDITTVPTDARISSVIATTGSGTVNLTETATGSGVYHYDMSTATRDPDDVDVTVILGKKEENLYIATVYKVGHDNKPGNTAEITNDTNSSLPDGTIWTGAYENDRLTVSVTTEPDYYAIVTAVIAGTTTPVPVLQWAVQGSFDATLTMPGANVDVTVTYTKDPPKSDLKLTLSGHEQEADNIGTVSDVAGTEPTLPLTANGGMAPDTSDYSVTKADVTTGIQLKVWGQPKTGYMVEKMELKVSGITIPLTMDSQNKAYTPLPYGDVEIIIYYKEGKRTPRPFDPEHSTIYMPSAEYPTAENPNLSNPDQEGWILAEPDDDRKTGKIVVTVPTLYEYKDPDHNLDDAGVDEDSTEDPKPVPPVYTFYWLDDLGVYHKLVEGTDITVSNKKSLDPTKTPNENPKGDYPRGTDPESHHYGYELTLTAIATSSSPFASYVEGGGTIYVTATRPDENESLMTQVVIPEPEFIATLYIVDVSSSLKNHVEMYVKGDPTYGGGPAVADKDEVKPLNGTETLWTDVTRGDPDVKVVSVLAIPETGSPTYLSLNALNHYPFDMVRDNVDIVVTLANKDEELYTATVVKVDPANDPGNTVRISNQTHPVLNRSMDGKWTAAYETDDIRVDVTAAPGYQAVVTAKRMDDDSALTVIPIQGGGVMVVTLPDKMPDSNIEITVTFETVEAPTMAWVTLQMRMDDAARTLPVDPGNWAEGTDGVTTLRAEDLNNYTDTQLLNAGTATLSSTVAAGYQIADVVMLVNGGTETSLGATATGFTVTGGDNIVVTVLLEETKEDDRTPRPFDPAHSDNVNYTDAEDHINHDNHGPGHTGPDGHQDGYLMAANKGNSRVEITVPNLYDGDLYPAEKVTYKLYAKIGGVMVELEEGKDYDTVIPVAQVGVTHTADGKSNWEGQVFTIQNLDPTGVLGDYVRKGGVIYITATEAGQTESAYTEVVIPADPNKDGYKATLKVIDDTTGKQNRADMQNANTAETVTWNTGDGRYPDPAHPDPDGRIYNLFGGELIRTEVTPDTGVTYTVMSYTESMGSVLLFPDPTGTRRYPKDMPSEDMDVIVHFRDRDLHIAAVQKRGATAVTDNEARIENLTTAGLNDGTIWTEGLDDDKIRVKVTTAEGYSATVTVSYVDPATGNLVRMKVEVGSGTSAKPFLVEFDMPHADVQVVVLFEIANRAPRPYDPEHSERYNAPDYPDTNPDDPLYDWSDNTSVGYTGWILADSQDDAITVLIPTLYLGDIDGNLDDVDALTDAGVNESLDPKPVPPTYTFYWREVDADTGAETYHPLVDGVDIDIDVSSMKSLDPTKTPNENPKGDFPKAVDPDPQIHHYGYELTFVPHKETDGSLLSDGAKLIADYIENGGIIYVTATSVVSDGSELESAMTQVVIRNNDIPKPSDPEDLNSDIYEDRWITTENWVDYLIVTVPTLDTDGNHPISVDPDEVTFRFYLTEGAERDPGNEIDVTDLLVMINPNIFFSEDPARGTLYNKPQMVWDTNGYAYPGAYMAAAKEWDTVANPAPTYRYVAEYESDNYYSGLDKDGVDTDFIGARFVLKILEDADTIDAANAAILQEIWDNYGTMSDDEDHQYRLYISALYTTWDDSGENVISSKESGKTDFEVKPYYTLSGILESYAPSHIATFSLYDQELVDTEGINVDQSDLSDLTAETPFLIYKQFKDWGFGSGLWQLEYAIRTSELMGTYTMLIEKPGHVSFTWSEMELSADTLDPADLRELTFTVAGQEKDASGNEIVAVDEDGRVLPGVIALFGGDINGDRYVRIEDYTVLSAFFGGRRKQTRVNDPTSTKWDNSTYNPESAAYWADIDGNLYVNTGDHAIWNTKRNYNKNYTDYAATWELRGAVIGVTTMEVALLMEEPEGLPPEEIQPEEIPPEEEPPDGETLPPEGEEPAGEPEPSLEEPPVPDEGDKSTEDKNPDMGDQTAENREPNEGEQPPEGEEKPPVDSEGLETEPEPPEPRPAPEEEDDESPKASDEDDDQVDKNENDLEINGIEPLI